MGICNGRNGNIDETKVKYSSILLGYNEARMNIRWEY